MTLLCFSILLLILSYASGQIGSAQDLNCDFFIPCMWFNATTGLEDDSEFLIRKAVSGTKWSNLVNDHSIYTPKSTCLAETVVATSQKQVFVSTCSNGQPFVMMISDSHLDDDHFAYAYSQSHDSSAWLVSAVVPSLQGSATLTLSYWKSTASPLFICGRKPSGFPNKVNCKWHKTAQTVDQNQWLTETATIPASDEPFEIIIYAQFREPGEIIVIDDIVFQGNVQPLENVNDSGQPFRKAPPKFAFKGGDQRPPALFIDPFDDYNTVIEAHGMLPTSTNKVPKPKSEQTATATQRTTEPVRTFPPLPRLKPLPPVRCNMVECTFESSFCGYTSTRDSEVTWKLARGHKGNALTGINGDSNGDGWFAFADGGSTSDGAIMSKLISKQFSTTRAGRLRFSYHIAGNKGSLQICDRSTENCPLMVENNEVLFNPENMKWRTAEVTLTPGFHQIIFIAKQPTPHEFVGLDNIELLTYDKSTYRSCCKK